MNKSYCFFIFCFFIVNYCNAQEINIWGVWNIGSKINSYIINTEDGSFLYSGDITSFIFESNDYGKGPIIRDVGRTYKIVNILKSDKNIISLYVYFMLRLPDEYPMAYFKLNIHLIDNNHIWMEVDYNDDKYPTDPRYNGYPFNTGKDVIYWREKIN